MDPYWKNDTPNYNGMNRMADGGHDKKARRNYKLIVDPALQGGPEKLYRFDGDLPEDPTPVMTRDPRSRFRRYLKREQANLPVPKFTYDIYYVGTPLPKEVTFTNLNDNINSNFLEDMCKSFGNIEEVQIFTHPKTRKHLGVGRVLFTSTRAARACAGKLDQVSRMGKIMTVFVDTMGRERHRILEDMTAEQAPLRPPSPDTPRRRSDPRAPFPETPHPTHRNDSRNNDYHNEPRGDEHGMHDYHSADKHMPDHRRKDHRGGNFHRGNDHARGHHHDNHYSHTPQSADLGYGSIPSDNTYTGSVSEHSSFISTPQTPHTPHTPQTPHGGFDNHYGQYGMAQNMGYNMNMPPSMNQNLPPQPGMPPAPHMQPPHSLPPPPVNMNQGYAGQYGMPQAPQPGGYEQPPEPHPHQHNQYQNSVHGHQNFHRKERDRDRDRDRFRDRDRDDWRRDRGGDRGGDRDRDRGNRRRDRDRGDRERERDRGDRDRGGERGMDRGTDRRSNHERFWSPPPPRAPSPEPEKQRVMSLESRIESLLRRNREEPAPPPVPVFGSGDEGSQGSGSSHGRREDYYEPQPPPCPQEQQAVPPLPMETPPPLPPPLDKLPPLPSRDELPPLPPLPPDMEAEAAALSLPSRHLNNSGSEHQLHSALPTCDNALSNPPLSVNYTEQAHCLYTDSQSGPPDTQHTQLNSDSAAELGAASTQAGFGAGCTPDTRTGTPCAADGTPVPEDTTMEDSDKAAGDDDDDDRMSLSSISSGEQKLEVNVPKPPEQQYGSRGAGNFPDMSRPPPNFWPGAQQQQNFSGSFSGSFGAQGAGYGQNFNGSPAKPLVTMTPEDELREQAFIGVLQQVIKEMKDILQKDLCKRMVQSSAFKSFEKWWDTEADRSKQPQRALDAGLSRTPVKSARGPPDRKQAALAATRAPPPGKTDSSSSISQLFENKEVGFGTNFGMGMGGLLGIRGGIPKLPSFRRKKFRPPSPPPEGEESQDVDVLRPPSPPPLESDEEDAVGKSDADELTEEGTPKSKPRKLVIEDSDDSDKSDSESEKESDVEEDEEEDEVSVASSEEEEEEESDEASSEEDEASELSSEEEEDEETELKAELSNLREDSALDTSDVEAAANIAEEKTKVAVPAVDTEAEEASESMPEAAESAAESEPDVKMEESDRSDAESIGKADEDEAMDTDDDEKEEDEEEEDEDEKEEEAEKLADSLHESSENEESAEPEATAETAKTKADSLSNEPELNHVKSELGNSEVDRLEPDIVKKEPQLDQTEAVRTGADLVKQEVHIVKTEVAKSQEESESAGVVRPTQPEIKVEPGEDESAEHKEAERTTSIDTLTDRERGAFDMLMELHHHQAEPPPTPDTHGTIKELITRPPLASPQEEVVQLDSGLEQDAVLALLQMHEPSRSVTIPAEFASPEPPTEPTPEVEVLNEHNYFGKMTDKQQVDNQEEYDSDITDSASEGEQDMVPTLPPEIQIDHGYCTAFHPVSKKASERLGSALIDIELPSVAEMQPHVTPPRDEDMIQDVEIELQEVKVEEKKPKKTKKERKKDKKLKDLTNLTTEIIKEEVTPPKPKPTLKPRSLQAEMQVMYDFLIRGIDEEDIALLKRRYDELLQDDSPQSYWLNDIHWVDHSQTHIPDPSPPKKKRKHSVADEPLRKHKTGCSRTEGYYKITHAEKLKYLEHNIHVTESQLEGDQRQLDANEQVKKKAQQTREARSETRRIQNVLSSRGEEVSDLLKFNQLKFRRKHLKFAKSGIHDWGLFALEPIAAEEMVIEYVGQVIRHSMANMREKKYEAVGIGSSYLFRVDSENVIDATRCGNLARFINHSCNPNCYAKIISVESRRKIVIYSKRDINVDDEITYDYKFPLEDEKITCLCGAPNCRGTLN